MQLPSRRRMLYILTVLLLVCDNLRRMMSGTRPVDWIMLVMEFLVLLLIAYEVAVPILEKRKIKKYRTAIVSLMTEGQELFDSPPDNRGTDPQPWIDAVDNWIGKARRQLQSYLPNALAAFNPDPYVELMSPQSIAHNARSHCYKLAGKLQNLKNITENLEVYS